MPSITPFIWFNGNLKEALDFYLQVFTKHEVIRKSSMGNGQLFSAEFILNDQKFLALSVPTEAKPSEVISLFISCEDQTEIDYYWERLTSQGGKPGRCGWLTDPFGITWQVVPKRLGSLIGHPEPLKAKKATEAMMKMSKLVIADLEKALAD